MRDCGSCVQRFVCEFFPDPPPPDGCLADTIEESKRLEEKREKLPAVPEDVSVAYHPV